MDIKNLAELKKELEERIEKADRELHHLKLSLKLVDEALTKVSFRPASELMEQQAREDTKSELGANAPDQKFVRPQIDEPSVPQKVEKPSPLPEEQQFPIKSKSGEDLGILYLGESHLRIVPVSGMKMSVRTPPFQTFFIDRVLGEMRRKDEMAVDAGSKDPMSMIEHEIVLDGEVIREIRIKNIDEDSRIREIRSSIRWTLERMLEKAGKQP